MEPLVFSGRAPSGWWHNEHNGVISCCREPKAAYVSSALVVLFLAWLIVFGPPVVATSLTVVASVLPAKGGFEPSD